MSTRRKFIKRLAGVGMVASAVPIISKENNESHHKSASPLNEKTCTTCELVDEKWFVASPKCMHT